jgi:hypothetical protein
MASQKIHFHVYGDYNFKKINNKVLESIENNKYFHIHAPVNADKLNQELKNYDYGFSPVFFNTNIINSLFPKTTIGNRIFNCIEAGIPIIVPDENEFIKKIIIEKGIGFSIESKNLENLKNIIEGKDYKKFKKNILKTQKEMRLSKKIKELEKFYAEVVS